MDLIAPLSLAQERPSTRQPQRANGTRKELIISTESSTPNTDQANAIALGAAEAPITSAQKAAATLRRHKDERREDSLREIRAQTAAGTLVVRQMTVAQHEAASQTARQTLARNEARGRARRGEGKSDKA
jgi:hypothetical protein